MSPKSAMTPSTAPKLNYKVICIGSREVRIILRTMKRKTLRLSINEVGEVEVRMPPRYPQREVANFISQHHRWIEQRLQHVEGQQANKRLHMRYLGDKYSYQTYDGEALSVSAPHIFYPEQWSQSRLEAEVDAWLRIRSRCYLQQRIDHWWPAFEKGALINKPVLRIKKNAHSLGLTIQQGQHQPQYAVDDVAPGADRVGGGA